MCVPYRRPRSFNVLLWIIAFTFGLEKVLGLYEIGSRGEFVEVFMRKFALQWEMVGEGNTKWEMLYTP